ncbi:MAG: hypothetical protein ACFCUP_11660 [Actinomycetales bacterium]
MTESGATRRRWRRDIAPAWLAFLAPRGVHLDGLPATGQGDQWARVKAVFDSLAHAGVKYAIEPTTSAHDYQDVRDTDAVLGDRDGSGQGTCLDLAVVFAGLCLDAALHPVVAVLDDERSDGTSHAVVLVWLDGDWPGRPDHSYPHRHVPSGLWRSRPDDPPVLLRPTAEGPGGWVAVDVSEATIGYPPDPSLDGSAWERAVARGARRMSSRSWAWGVGVDVGVIPTMRPDAEALDPPYRQRTDEQRDSPLTALEARYEGGVPFCGRDAYDALWDWCTSRSASGERVRATRLVGVGGAGKTRLAAELCHRLADEGWSTGFARRTTPDARDEDRLADDPRPLLIVIDYPEGFSGDWLTRWLRALARRDPDLITAILFVGRAAGDGLWWSTVEEAAKAAGLGSLRAGGARVLDARHPSPQRVYREARARFEGRVPRSEPLPHEPALGTWTTLDLVMLAWLAAHGTDTTSGMRTRDELYKAVFDHEFQHHWRPAYQRVGGDLLVDDARIAAAVVSVVQPPPERAEGVLRRAEVSEPRRVAALLRELLPADPGLSVRPDPIADHLVVALLSEQRHLVIRALTPVPADTATDPGYEVPEAFAASAAEVISRAAYWYPDESETRRQRLDDAALALLRSVPAIALPSLVAALRVGGPFARAWTTIATEALAETIDAAPHPGLHGLTWGQVHDAIPTGHTALQDLALASARLASRELPADVSAEERQAHLAMSLTNLGIRLAEAGRREEALDTLDRVVEELPAPTGAFLLARLLTAGEPGPWVAEDLVSAALPLAEKGVAEGSDGWTGYARRTLRAVASRMAPASAALPLWVTAPWPEDVVEGANAWMSARGSAARTQVVHDGADRMTTAQWRGGLDLLRFLHPEFTVELDELSGLLEAVTNRGLEPALAEWGEPRQAVELVAQWVGTRTWDESHTFFEDHRTDLTATRSREILRTAGAAEGGEVAAQHVALLDLVKAVGADRAFAVAADPDAAIEVAWDAVVSADGDRLVRTAQVNPRVLRAPVIGAVTMAVLLLLQRVSPDTDIEPSEQAAALLRVAAEQGGDGDLGRTRRDALAARLRRLAARRPQLQDELERVIASFVDMDTAPVPADTHQSVQ